VEFWTLRDFTPEFLDLHNGVNRQAERATSDEDRCDGFYQRRCAFKKGHVGIHVEDRCPE
jgi:hypothetical protein